MGFGVGDAIRAVQHATAHASHDQDLEAMLVAALRQLRPPSP
jgi:hypothetical protein